MRDHSKHIRMTRKGLVCALLDHREFEPGSEIVAVDEAAGRVLAEDVTSAVTMPNALTCNMDSVALRFSDFESGEAVDESTWTHGVQWQFANTGVAMPEGFDTALRIESVKVTEGDDGVFSIELLEYPQEKGQGTTQPGARVKEGELVLSANTALSAYDLAVLSSCGVLEVPVIAKPKVGFIPTGNELVAPTANVPEGKNIDSNSTLLRALITEWGGVPVMYPIVPDKRDLIEATVKKACDECDIVVINGGSSKGSDDWTIEVLEELGEVYCHETDQGPGKHASASKVNGTLVVGISGPSRGAVTTTRIFLKPVIDVWLGQEPEMPAPKEQHEQQSAPQPEWSPQPEWHGEPSWGWGYSEPDWSCGEWVPSPWGGLMPYEG